MSGGPRSSPRGPLPRNAPSLAFVSSRVNGRRENPRLGPDVFHHLTSEVTYHYFCHIRLVTQPSCNVGGAAGGGPRWGRLGRWLPHAVYTLLAWIGNKQAIKSQTHTNNANVLSNTYSISTVGTNSNIPIQMVKTIFSNSPVKKYPSTAAPPSPLHQSEEGIT